MRFFSGDGGELYSVSDLLHFAAAPMRDCGDGWDWRVEDVSLRFLDQATAPIVEVWESQAWRVVDPVAVEFPTGRVSLGRCFEGGNVRLSGTCRPLSSAGRSAAWSLLVPFEIQNRSALGFDDARTRMVPSGTTSGSLTGIFVDPPPGDLCAVLPTGHGGAFVGLCVADTAGRQINLRFQEGVQYAAV